MRITEIKDWSDLAAWIHSKTPSEQPSDDLSFLTLGPFDNVDDVAARYAEVEARCDPSIEQALQQLANDMEVESLALEPLPSECLRHRLNAAWALVQTFAGGRNAPLPMVYSRQFHQEIVNWLLGSWWHQMGRKWKAANILLEMRERLSD